MTVIRRFTSDLAGVRSANADVRLRVEREPEAPDELVLSVEYPAPTSDPAGRDIHIDAVTRDWTGGTAITFRIKPERAFKLSVSFLDRNGVAYTAWREVKAGSWQTVRIAFDEIRPNPYFQPPGARTGAPLDVSDVRGIAFSPQDQGAGRLSITEFVVSR